MQFSNSFTYIFLLLQILATLNLLSITSKFDTVAMVVIVNIQSCFIHTSYVCMLSLRSKFHMPNSSVLLGIAIKWKAKYRYFCGCHVVSYLTKRLS
jgi:hypothetical protein